MLFLRISILLMVKCLLLIQVSNRNIIESYNLTKRPALVSEEEKRRANRDARASAEFKDGVLDIVGPVLINELPLGIIGIQVDLQPLFVNVVQRSIIAVLFLLAAFIIAHFLAKRLQLLIAAPIASLIQVMTKVSSEGNYSHRESVWLRMNSVH